MAPTRNQNANLSTAARLAAVTVAVETLQQDATVKAQQTADLISKMDRQAEQNHNFIVEVTETNSRLATIVDGITKSQERTEQELAEHRKHQLELATLVANTQNLLTQAIADQKAALTAAVANQKEESTNQLNNTVRRLDERLKVLERWKIAVVAGGVTIVFLVGWVLKIGELAQKLWT